MLIKGLRENTNFSIDIIILWNNKQTQYFIDCHFVIFFANKERERYVERQGDSCHFTTCVAVILLEKTIKII